MELANIFEEFNWIYTRAITTSSQLALITFDAIARKRTLAIIN